MNYDALKIWVDVAQFLVTGLIGVYLWWERHNDAAKRRLDHLEEQVDVRLDGATERLTRVEEAVRMGPNHDDLKRMHSRMDAVSEELREIKGEQRAANRTLDLIHQYLLNGKQA